MMADPDSSTCKDIPPDAIASPLSASFSIQSGGYDYDFVEEPSKELQCSICLSVLRDPHLTSCCGNHFCKLCVENIKKEENPCPLCQEKVFSTMLNKSIARKVRELTIRCPNQDDGCQWVGQLKDVEAHLDAIGENEDCCNFVVVECDQCNEPFARITLANHKTESCLFRPFVCEYCGFKDTWKSITVEHWPICGEYPVPCPNECGNDSLKRKDVESHVKTECPLQLVPCEFAFAGCKIELPRKAIEDHMMTSLMKHVSMLGGVLQQTLTEKDKKITDLKGKLSDQANEFQARIKELEKRMTELKDRDGYQPMKVERCPPVDFYMKELQTLKTAESQWLSDPFYTHPGGYKMCLSVFANGIGKGKGNYISVFANIMRGEYDDHLNWPFQGIVRVTLITPSEDFKRSLIFTSSSPPKASKRVTEGEFHIFGQGEVKFLQWDNISHLSFLQFHLDSVECRSV